MLGNSKMREAILQHYEESGDLQAVFEVIKRSQEMFTVENDRRLIDVVLGKRK